MGRKKADETPEGSLEIVADEEASPLTTEEHEDAKHAQAVADAAKKVAEAQAALDAAAAVHAEAKAAHAAVLTSRDPVPTFGEHIFVDFGGGPVLRDAPKGYDAKNPDRSLRVDGQNVEHVHDFPTADGDIWMYRKM